MVPGDRGGAHGAELVLHQLPEVGQAHTSRVGAPVRPARPHPSSGTGAAGPPIGSLGVVDVVFAQIGLPTPAGYEWLGPVLAVLGLVAALVVLLRWWFSHRR